LSCHEETEGDLGQRRQQRRRVRLAFEERFPPISDAELLARCAPGTRPDVALKVRRIVSDALGVDYPIESIRGRSWGRLSGV
jgi:hypothetical protein